MPATKKKKPAVKKAAPKKVAVRKKSAKLESFKITQSELPFLTFKITQQTFYWTILLIFVLIVQVWVLNLQLDVTDLLNSVEQQISNEL